MRIWRRPSPATGKRPTPIPGGISPELADNRLYRRAEAVRQKFTYKGDVMPRNRGTRRNPRYVGVVSYKGHSKWVGTHQTIANYRQAEYERLSELRDEIDLAEMQRAPTVMEFAGATLHAGGRITMKWPDGQRASKEAGRRPCSVTRMRDGLKLFVREFGDRPLDSFTRQEALAWALPRGRHVQQAVRQFFNHALDRELVTRNVFARLGIRRRIRRIDRPDFEPITDEQYERLCRCARTSRTNSYVLALEGVILAIGETALRPGEIFGLHHTDIDYSAGIIRVRRQLDMATGLISWPKNDKPREVVMSSRLQGHLRTMPRMSKEIVFPTPRGVYMRRSTWSVHWNAIRVAAGMPGQAFYELRHRAIQWMIDPTHDGGLGLDIQTVAHLTGHNDGGYLIASTYTKLNQQRARARTQRALNTYRQQTSNSSSTTREAVTVVSRTAMESPPPLQ
jgi:integrase